MSSLPILSIIIFLPLVGVLLLSIINSNSKSGERNLKHTALWVVCLNFIISIVMLANFDQSDPNFQFTENYFWINSGISYHLGVDGISILLVILTTFLMPFCILASFESIKVSLKEYLIAFLILETLMIGVFCSLDLILFYLFFEGGLIPMFLIIGIWGGERRVYSTFKFFLFTLAGSVFMLLAIIAIYIEAGTTDIVYLLQYDIDPSLQYIFWLAFFASFAVKIPMWPVHTWLPDAHVEAPTAGSVILAGVLLKMAGYGFIRFSLGMFPIASSYFAPFIFTLSIIAIIYASLIALVQKDMKKLIAYSSVAHMGFVTLGIFTFTLQGIEGAMIQMISHGIVSAALFLCVGVVYDRIHTREIERYGGLVNRMPLYSFVFMIFIMGSIGLPGTSGFVGEFLVLLAIFSVNTYFAVFATTGVVLAAAYSLWLYRKVIFGSLIKEDLLEILDLSRREIIILFPLAFLTIFFGFYPQPLIDIIEPATLHLISNISDDLIVIEQINQVEPIIEMESDY
ncbi:MAG: NADH-quinone oxidoreductase subunit M [Candidatus Pelagibacterales bacterium]|jgi:NADH-quinone oxidoreductase subunit M|tara:strand:- start:578 stop:2113 length:1536 start_codon:yes stop_codon:yes gene_type:complete